MGINRFLTHRMIGGCLYSVDSPSPAKPRKRSSNCVKLIMMDGKIEIFHRPIPASELLEKHPNHRICRSDSFTIGQKIPSLQEGELLKLGGSYFLLPLHLFQSVLSFVTLASSFSSFKSPSTSALLMQQPFEVHKTPSGKLQIRVSDDFIEKIEEIQKVNQEGAIFAGRVCNTSALEKDYRQLVLEARERRWKPKLEAIKEIERKKDRRERRKEEKKKKKSMNLQQEQKIKKLKKKKKEGELHVLSEDGKLKKERKGRSKKEKT